ncbi:MAG: glycogen/starch/alpha-glucan phosphorylase, partial [Clostridia bacterium]
QAYKNKDVWNKMSLMNIANAGRFAADRAIEQYVNEIWDIKKIEV